MTQQRPSKAQLERQLQCLRRDYEAAKARMAKSASSARAHCKSSTPPAATPTAAAPTPSAATALLAAHLEGARQDRHSPTIRRRRRPLPAVDRKPPPARSPPGPDARPLPPGRRTDTGQPRPPIPRAAASPPPAPLSQLEQPKPRDITMSPAFAPLNMRHRAPKTTAYQALLTRPEIATPK